MRASEFFTLWARHIKYVIRRRYLQYRLKNIDMCLDVISDSITNGLRAQKELHRDRVDIVSELRRS